MEQNYTFTSIEKVEYRCVRDIPTGIAEYKLTSVITNEGVDVVAESEFFTEIKEIPWREDDRLIIPYPYKSTHDSVTAIVRHKPTRITKEFTIEFDKWDLVFEDHFDGTELNKNNWEYCPNFLRAKGYANYWKDDMSFVDGNSNLVSRAYATGKVDEDGKPICYSGAIWSKGLVEHKYGYYEVCAKLHHKTGMWGAFWLVTGDMGDGENCPDDNSAVGGAEVDVFESLFNLGCVNSTVHWDGWAGKTKSMHYHDNVTQVDVYDGQYHKFAFRWSPDEYVFLIDGVVTLRTTVGGICKEPGYINLTTECGTWAGDWVLKEGEYSDMLIDYVRVYQTPSDNR